MILRHQSGREMLHVDVLFDTRFVMVNVYLMVRVAMVFVQIQIQMIQIVHVQQLHEMLLLHDRTIEINIVHIVEMATSSCQTQLE